jgi:flavin-dependent dehydrogenase
MKREQAVDVAVIGGGPAGSILATLVAEAGFEAMLFESERFPRFQIGESLLPVANLALRRVGIDLDTKVFSRRRARSFTMNETTDARSIPSERGLPERRLPHTKSTANVSIQFSWTERGLRGCAPEWKNR